jgi:prepilin-type processing-associated H-X9-DG protein
MASARCLDNLRQMGAATGMYLQDYDATFPFAWGMPGPYDWNTWATGLAPYLKLPKGDADHIRNAPVFHCPADDDGPSPISYATNALISGAYWEEDRWKTTRIYPAENLASITNLAQVVWIGDTNKGDWNRTKQFDDTITDWVRPDIELGYPKTDDRAVAFYRQWLKERDWTDLKAAALDCPDGLYRCKYPAFRHARKGPRSGYADFLFVDGHVKACRWGQLNIVNFFPAPTPQQISKYNQ